MTKPGILILTFVLLISMKCFSQHSNEIGIGLTTDSDSRVFLNYKLALEDKPSINFRLSQGWFKEEQLTGERYYQVDADPKTYYEASYLTNQTLQTRLSVGPEFQIRTSNFSWGIEGIVGYQSKTQAVQTNTHNVSHSEHTLNNLVTVYPNIKSEQSSFYKQEYLVTGIQGRFILKAMVTERLGIKLFGEIGLDCNFQLTNVIEYPGELNSKEENISSNLRMNYFLPRFRLGAALFLTH